MTQLSLHQTVLLAILFLSFSGSLKDFAVAAPVTTSTDQLSTPSCKDLHQQQDGALYDPESFSKLKLKVNELFGSRWAIDRTEAITVFHAIDITDATLIHDNQFSLRVEFNLRQTWEAPGLEFPEGLFKDVDPPGTFVSADDKVLQNMWSPDSYVSTSRESSMNTVGTPLSLVYIFKNRTIIFKVRMFTKVGCTSSFQWYPLDIQSCTLAIESYKYHNNIAIYQWTDEKMYRPVVYKIRRLFQYDLQTPLKHFNGTVERGGRGKRYAYVGVKFTFERKLGHNIIQVYTPTILVVVLSWFSFWLGLDAIPGRISLLVTCMLTLVTMHSGIKTDIPTVHYITMMDVWMVCCMAMVFSAMCEFVVIKYVHWRQQQKQQLQGQTIGGKVGHGRDNSLEIPRIAWGKLENELKIVQRTDEKLLRSVATKSCKPFHEGGDVAGGRNEEMHQMTTNHKEKNCGKEKTDKTQQLMVAPLWVAMDKFCRGFFPSLFCIFNVVYWPMLLNSGSEIREDESYQTFYS